MAGINSSDSKKVASRTRRHQEANVCATRRKRHKHKKKKIHSNHKSNPGEQQLKDHDGITRIRGDVETHPAPTVVEKRDAERKEDTAYERKKYRLEFWTLFVLGIYTAVALYSAYLTRDIAKTSRDQFRLDQRAWVGVKSAKVTTLVAGQKLRAELVLVNTGRTLAVNATITSTIISHHGPFTVSEYAQSPMRPAAKIPPSTAILFPNAENFVPAETDGVITPPTLNAINTGSEIVHFFGEVSYEDIFQSRHVTRFCYQYFPTDGAFHWCAENYSHAD